MKETYFRMAAFNLFISFGRSSSLIVRYPNMHMLPAAPRLSMYLTVDAVFIRDKGSLFRAALKETVYSSLLAKEFARILSLILCLLRKIVGPETDVITGEWRRLHNEEL